MYLRNNFLVSKYVYENVLYVKESNIFFVKNSIDVTLTREIKKITKLFLTTAYTKSHIQLRVNVFASIIRFGLALSGSVDLRHLK